MKKGLPESCDVKYYGLCMVTTRCMQAIKNSKCQLVSGRTVARVGGMLHITFPKSAHVE